MKILSIILFIVSLTFAAEQNKLDNVTLFLKWKHQFQFAGFYIAKEKGFYKEFGLDVTIKESKNNQNHTKQVLKNKNSFGISDSELIYEKILGKNISLLGAIFQHSPLVFLSLEDNKIVTPHDLYNKKIMVDFNTKENILLNIFIKQYSLDKKNLKILPTTYNIDDLITGKVDVFTAYRTNEVYTLQDKKIDYNYISPTDYGYDFYGDILFTSTENVNNNPKRVDAFYEASLRGWKYAFSHIDETINLILEKYNTQNFSYDKYFYEANILKELSEIEKGNLGKLELSRINNILSLYFLTTGNFNSKSINNLDISTLVKNYQYFNINNSQKKEEMEDELIKLIKKPFYEMNEEQIKNIFDVFLEKNYIIALQLYDTFLNKVIFTSWKENNKISHEFMAIDDKKFEYKLKKVKNILIDNKKVGFVKIYYNNHTIFTNYELKYLNEKKEFLYCNRNNLAPYSYFENNIYKGMVVDYINTIQEKLKVNIKALKTNTWEECIQLVKEKKVDFSSLIITKPNSYKYLNASKAYVDDYLVLATKIDEPFLIDFINIEKKVIAIDKTSKNIKKFIKSKYPSIKIKEFQTEDDALDAVMNSEVFGYIGLSTSIAFRIQNNYPFQLKIMTKIDESANSGSIGVHKDNKILLSILNKVIDSIPEKRKREIKNSWIPIKQESSINYNLIWKIILIVVILFMAFTYRQYLLKKVNKDLKKTVDLEVSKNREKDKLIFQQSKLASMGEMLNNIAHQWRQPLNSINSNVAVLDATFIKQEISNKKLDDSLSDIENQTKYMSDTIESFRNYFNPKKDKHNFMLSKAVENALNIVGHNFNNANIEIYVSNKNDLSINGYLGEYIQTIISILNNAKDAFLYNNINSPKIIICIDRMLAIDDNAGGIDESIIERVFEPYFTTKHKEKGTGIGLYMSKMLIEKSMNGSLSVENIKNGTRFKIKL